MNLPSETASKASSSLELCEANITDLLALSSIFAKSFHPVSSFMKQAIPDTLQTSQWWSEVNTFALTSLEGRIMKIVDRAADRRIVALAQWCLPPKVRAMAVDAGSWSAVPLTADHDAVLCNAFIGLMVEQRRAVMQDRPHFCEFCFHSTSPTTLLLRKGLCLNNAVTMRVSASGRLVEVDSEADGCASAVLEVLATIHDYKGRGAGKMLLEWGCDQADEAGVEVFVETNHAAVPFYQKFGFELKVEADMPGGFGYTEYVLVRPAKK